MTTPSEADWVKVVDLERGQEKKSFTTDLPASLGYKGLRFTFSAADLLGSGC